MGVGRCCRAGKEQCLEGREGIPGVVEKKVVCKLQPTPGHSDPRPGTFHETSISPSAGHSRVLPAPGGSFRIGPGVGKNY